MPTPIGIYWTEDYGTKNPERRPVKRFEGNTAHSSGFYWSSHGSCIYTGGILQHINSSHLSYTSGRDARSSSYSTEYKNV